MKKFNAKNRDKDKFRILNVEVGEYIRKNRLKKGLSGRELGEIIGVSQQQISRYERGENNISISDFSFILSVLNVNFQDFIKFSSIKI